jgi:hypothetical protein
MHRAGIEPRHIQRISRQKSQEYKIDARPISGHHPPFELEIWNCQSVDRSTANLQQDQSPIAALAMWLVRHVGRCPAYKEGVTSLTAKLFTPQTPEAAKLVRCEGVRNDRDRRHVSFRHENKPPHYVIELYPRWDCPRTRGV